MCEDPLDTSYNSPCPLMWAGELYVRAGGCCIVDGIPLALRRGVRKNKCKHKKNVAEHDRTSIVTIKFLMLTIDGATNLENAAKIKP